MITKSDAKYEQKLNIVWAFILWSNRDVPVTKLFIYTGICNCFGLNFLLSEVDDAVESLVYRRKLFPLGTDAFGNWQYEIYKH
jgi:hypothetical protein